MRNVPAAMTAAWKAQAKTGDQRPVVRATIQHASLRKFDYDTALAPGGDFDHDRHRTGIFTSIVFGDPSDQKEIRNIKNYSWTRATDQDVATCTMTILNSDITPIGNQEEAEHAEDFDLPGFFTYNRGDSTVEPNPWGFTTQTGWNNTFVPDRVVRTYEGYGSDPDVAPTLDPNLVQSGTWLIDKVTYSDQGDITLEMRDIGRLLLDQIVFPPVVPFAEYPLEWEPIRSEQVPARDCTGGSWGIPTGPTSSSNDAYIGLGLQDPPYPVYVGAEGGVDNHKDEDALIPQDGVYWWSTGQTTYRSKVWWQVDLDNPQSIAGIRINPKGGPYRIYISLKNANGWIGKKKIPYAVTTEGVDVGADIPFVQSVAADRRNPFDVILKRKFKDITAVRLTFTQLQDTKVGNYPFRAGLDLIHLYTGAYASLGFADGSVLKVVGNYRDYTAIVKWACAWGGFYWPPSSTNMDYVQLSWDADPNPEGGRRTISYASEDTALPKGRVWGDFMQTGTVAAEGAKLTMDLFDKKPLLDMINYLRDVTGFLFFIDETGGVVWRIPNLGLNVAEPKLGNYLSPTQLGQRTRARTASIVTIDESETLLEYSTTLDSSNLRERIFVADLNGKVGTTIKGYRPSFHGHGLRRVAGWTDQRFGNKGDTRVMADLLAARQMFTYRRGRVRMPGYPGVQVDDQVRIFERVTNETFYHYVSGITSSLDMEQGTWFYDMDTHWLGERPSDAWVVKVTDMDAVTQAYLNGLS